MFPYRAFGGFDSATASTSAATSAARAGIEIMSTQCTHVDLNTLGGRLTEWGSNGAAFGHNPQLGCVGSTNGSGGAASLGTAGLGTSEHAGTQARQSSMRTRGGEGSARLRLLDTSLEVLPHALASGLFAPRGGGARVWARPGVLLSRASCLFLERRLSSLLLRVDRALLPLVGYPPLGEKDRHCSCAGPTAV